jgi:hypothetical protein
MSNLKVLMETLRVMPMSKPNSLFGAAMTLKTKRKTEKIFEGEKQHR